MRSRSETERRARCSGRRAIPRTSFYPDRKWQTGFVGNSYLFADGAERLLDARTMFLYYATGITPAMANAKPGTGSAYAAAFLDSQDRPLDGAKTYKVTLPGPVPAKQFWSFTAYDNQTRSLLETDQKTAGIDSHANGLKANHGRFLHRLVRAQRAQGRGEQLGPDEARQGLQRAAAALRAARAVVREVVETGRLRAGGLRDIRAPSQEATFRKQAPPQFLRRDLRLAA